MGVEGATILAARPSLPTVGGGRSLLRASSWTQELISSSTYAGNKQAACARGPGTFRAQMMI